MHLELAEEIEQLENGIEFYSEALEEDRVKLYQLQSDPEHLEKFAREEYWMCKENEEVFLVEL
jgi:cell division protein FtsB